MENREMNHTDHTTKKITDTIKLNDIGFRLILIPFFGIMIPLITGLIDHSEKTNWPDRVRMIREQGTQTTFTPFDRFAMYKDSMGKSLNELLSEFESLRKANMQWVRSLKLTEQDLDKKGTHPQFGEVTLSQLLSAMVVHDLSHISQVVRVMSKQYKEEVGPWAEFFRLLKS